MVEIYCDGAYSFSRNTGGWAFVVVKDNEKIYSDFYTEFDTTNNRMEIQAAIEACKWAIENSVKDFTLYTDSMYVIGTMTMNWKRNKNLDLWPELEKVRKDLNINWLHVKGHSGNKYNELCDILAVQASSIVIPYSEQENLENS